MSLMTEWPDDDLETETLDMTADGSVMNDEFLQEAICEHAKFLGMDPDIDQDYLYIAEEALTAPLPDGWQQAEAEDGTPYHFNPDTGESLWEHPLDEVYRQKFRDAKERGDTRPNHGHISTLRSTTVSALPHDAVADDNAAAAAADWRREQAELEASHVESLAAMARAARAREEEEKAAEAEKASRRVERERVEERERRESKAKREEERKKRLAEEEEKDDWLQEIEEMSTLGKVTTTPTDTTTDTTTMDTTTTTTVVQRATGGDWDDDDDDDDDDMIGGGNLKQLTAESSAITRRAVEVAKTEAKAEAKAEARKQREELEHNMLVAAAESKEQLRSKDGTINDLRKRLGDQRIEYEEILSEQKEVLLSNGVAMDELTELHATEIRELTETINSTRSGTQSVREAHTLDVERLQTEVNRLRKELNENSDIVVTLEKEMTEKNVIVEEYEKETEELKLMMRGKEEELILVRQQLVASEKNAVDAQGNVVKSTRVTDDLRKDLKKIQSKNDVLQRAKAGT